MADDIPLCPKCGTLARFVLLTTRVKFELGDDGEAGRVVRHQKIEQNDDQIYECGGGHRFTNKGEIK